MQSFFPDPVRGYADRNRLKVLWREAFGDSFQTIDFLYGCGYLSDDRIWAVFDGSDLICACVCFPLCGRENCLYLAYAATDTRFRGRGAMSGLIESVKKSASSVALIPADPSLFDFYERLGFYPSLFVNRKHIVSVSPAGEREYFTSENFDLESIYQRYREEYSSHGNALYKNFEIFRASVLESSFWPGGGFCRFGGGYGFALERDGTIFLREPFGRYERLAATFPEVTLELPAAPGEEKTAVGMLYGGGPVFDGYINNLLN